MIEGVLQSPRLENYIMAIGDEQSLCNMYSYEQKCLNNIRNIYQHADKCDDQQNLKDIIYAAMVNTPEKITDDSLSLPMTSTSVKKPSAVKSLCLFTNIFDVKNRTTIRHVEYAK